MTVSLDKVCRAFVLGSVPFAVWLHVGDPVRATATPQPAGHASHGASYASPPFGDHQAQGGGQ
jgi:hypothetical protein